MKKIVVTCLAFVLAIVASITGTLAWLTAESDEVTNTFTVGDVAITLVEHQYNPDDTDAALLVNDEKVAVTNQNYPMIPGTTYFKDPTVSVDTTTNVDCYLFVKFEKINTPDTYLTYTSALDQNDSGWTKLANETDVWYRTVDAEAGERSWYLISGNTVTVKSTIIKSGATPGQGQVNMPAANAAPSLKYTAYAVQKDNLTVADAWAQVKPTT